jgi:hypothetical protein
MVMCKNEVVEKSEFQQFRSLLYLFGQFYISFTGQNIAGKMVVGEHFMTHIPYSYKRPHSERYIFTSVGNMVWRMVCGASG